MSLASEFARRIAKMDFTFTKEQNLLKRSFREFLSKECSKDSFREAEGDGRGHSTELWQKMAELGWLGLIFPEEYGGQDGSFFELTLLLEEMGYFCLQGPFFTAMILGGLPILDVGNEVQKKEFLPKIAKGDLIVTLALPELSPSRETLSYLSEAVSTNDNRYFISGTKLLVPDMNVADYVICVARIKDSAALEERLSLFLVDTDSPGIHYGQLKTISGDKYFEAVFNNVQISGGSILGEMYQTLGEIRKTVERGVIGKCAEMVGGAQWVLETTVKYAKERIQFDHPIGSFQAIQHKCANMLVDLEGARLVTYEAGWRLSEGLSCAMEASIAKAWVGEACRRICAEGHQIHGGIGIMKDHDMHLYSRRAKVAELIFGDADFHRELLAQQLGL
jgi:alkylation response protein AidB-like acyl-CoA dehydrogenase